MILHYHKHNRTPVLAHNQDLFDDHKKASINAVMRLKSKILYPNYDLHQYQAYQLGYLTFYHHIKSSCVFIWTHFWNENMMLKLKLKNIHKCSLPL